MKIPSQDLVAIGKIVAPHGVRGDVRIMPLTDFPERFRKLKETFLADGTNLAVEGVKYHKQFVLLKFRGLDSMNAVEHLRNQILHVQEQDLVGLPEGQYYHFQIIGLSVYNEADELLGTITDILATGSNDVYVAETAGQKSIMIPALKEVVKTIDLANKKMIVKLQEEWKD
ncbi:MAG: ribosome maturation factor RimM [Pelosinus sp.]|nr:ribosome maturation factor RimM [Pelosinus sp.]